MKIWIIADTHFGHNIMVEKCGRPHDFNEKILSNIEKNVRKEDVLIHLGDFCIGDDKAWHKLFCDYCNCKKWLITGNHDKRTKTWYMENGWDAVADTMSLNIYGKHILFSHSPVDPGDSFDINIHGHHHNTNHHPEDYTTERNILIHIEDTLSPVLLQTHLNKFEKRTSLLQRTL